MSSGFDRRSVSPTRTPTSTRTRHSTLATFGTGTSRSCSGRPVQARRIPSGSSNRFRGSLGRIGGGRPSGRKESAYDGVEVAGHTAGAGEEGRRGLRTRPFFGRGNGLRLRGAFS